MESINGSTSVRGELRSTGVSHVSLGAPEPPLSVYVSPSALPSLDNQSPAATQLPVETHEIEDRYSSGVDVSWGFWSVEGGFQTPLSSTEYVANSLSELA
jgi:hypothetical protein